ncbi:MAG: recombinase family protein [Candidatus Aureabacteria bacterium]|nr:recombinase family protein [Candidatus Auribacterota bacterium]
MNRQLGCAIYTRVSTDNQAEVVFNSCEAQELKIRAFIASQEDMGISKVYSDAGYTGSNLNRPALNEMLTDIQQGKINVVISYKIDRLTRSPKDFYHLVERFEKHGVDFISVTERFDTSTPSGRLLRNIMLTFAQFERELISERTKDKMIQRAQKGMWNGGTLPYGYKIEDKKLIINESEAKIVRSIYDNYILSGSLSQTYGGMKDKGIIDRKGKPFSMGAISYILRNVLYIGKLYYAGKVYLGIHEPNISEDIFNAAQNIHRTKKTSNRISKYFAMAGLIQCKECGSFMTLHYTKKIARHRSKRYHYYRCTKTLKRDWDSCTTRQVSANKLEDYIAKNLERISLDKQYIDSLTFKLNNDRAGGRTGFEPGSEDQKICPNQVEQDLKNFIKGLAERKGLEKNLWGKNFIQKIIYSKEQIELNLYYFEDPSLRPSTISGLRSPRLEASGPSAGPAATPPTTTATKV